MAPDNDIGTCRAGHGPALAPRHAGDSADPGPRSAATCGHTSCRPTEMDGDRSPEDGTGRLGPERRLSGRAALAARLKIADQRNPPAAALCPGGLRPPRHSGSLRCCSGPDGDGVCCSPTQRGGVAGYKSSQSRKVQFSTTAQPFLSQNTAVPWARFLCQEVWVERVVSATELHRRDALSP